MALISERFADDGKPILELSEIQEKYIKLFTEKCRSGEYTFRERECECGHADYEIIAQKDRYGISMNTVICRNCGLIVTNPCLDDKSNSLFYDNEYHYIYRAEENPSEETFLERKKAAKEIISFIRKHTSKMSGKVLEIGCADGRNVAAFAESGYDACGIDLSHTYTEFGRSKGLNLVCSDAESFAQRGEKYDIIVLNHVLEHFTDLKKELDVISSMMALDGVLFVAVPGVKILTFGSYQGDFLRLLQNAHIYNFTKTTLCACMARLGFECIFCNEFIYSVFKKGRSSSLVENAYADTIRYLQKTEEANGNIRELLIDRAQSILSEFGSGEVILYGTADELDGLVQGLTDLSSIKGFFYSDSKTPEQVVERILSSMSGTRCIMIADSRQNESLVNSFGKLIAEDGISLYSVYREMF